MTMVQPIARRPRFALQGRIRAGFREGAPPARGEKDKRRPQKSSTLIFTSDDRQAIDEIAALYGGTVEPWQEQDGKWVVRTTSSEVAVVLPPEDTAFYGPYNELWTKSVNKRRCNGVEAEVTDDQGGRSLEPCLCRKAQAASCAFTFRCSVILPEITFGGVWRVDTKSEQSAEQLIGVASLIQTMDIARGAGDTGMHRGRLKLVQMDSGARHYPLWTLALDQGMSMDALAAGETVVRAIAPGTVAAPGLPSGVVEEDVAEGVIVDDGDPYGAPRAVDVEIRQLVDQLPPARREKFMTYLGGIGVDTWRALTDAQAAEVLTLLRNQVTS